MNELEQDKVIQLIKKEVLPAIGCTEPIAVALAVAKAKEILGCTPKQIDVYLSANIIKNAMGVGIPNTNMVGLPIAIAMGALDGKSEYLLEVLKDCNQNTIEKGKELIAQKCINIFQKKDIDIKLYIEVICSNGKDCSKAIIAHDHTNFIHIAKNEQILFDKKQNKIKNETENKINLSIQKIYDFATQTPLSKIEFILEAAKLNMATAEHAFKENYGLNTGKILKNKSKHLMGETLYTKMLYYTSSACDARMGGANIPVMSNSGSGNQGITATNPIVVYAQENHCSQEQLVRALILSHLTIIYIKQHLGKLSALCGCVVAATGSSCGITYLMGGDFEQICATIKNMIANISGMICDGAKPGCSLKIATGISTAILSALLAINNECVSNIEGIIDNDVDQTIKNLAYIGTIGMNETDKCVLEIMTNKC